MKPVPHTHTCFGCWKDYPCGNAHCEDLEWRYCRVPTCPMPESMKKTESLMDAGHQLHEALFILQQGGNEGEAYQVEWVRNRILARLKELNGKLGSIAKLNKDMMQGAVREPNG